MEEQQIEI